MLTENLINVLSFHTSAVGIKAKDFEYVLPASDGKTPSIIPLNFTDIQFINANSNSFKTGFLTFEDDRKKELYEALRITDWESILSNDDIEAIILNPTLDDLQKLVDIKDAQLFERVRGVMTSMENAGADITTKVKNTINERYREIRNGRINNTGILLRPKDVERVEVPEVKELKAQLEEMKAMMATLIANKASESAPVAVAEAEKTDEEVVVEVADEVLAEPAKKAGRPPKSVK